MGEARRRAEKRKEAAKSVKPMTRHRFDLYAIGTRMAASRLVSEEVSYWSSHDEKLLGMVFFDTIDKDFMWMLLARDRVGRFRAVEVYGGYKSVQLATDMLHERMATVIAEVDIRELGSQGDEPNTPFDVLHLDPGVDRSKLHPSFLVLLETPGRAPSRAVMKEVGPWLAPSDPHFVFEFQTKGFDQRIWELYLWAAFRELGFDIEQPEAPDFLCTAPGIKFAVEATTVTASLDGPLAAHPNPQTLEEVKAFLDDYMPMKFGSSLTSKLNKKNAQGESYWERPLTAKRPFILAVADFHKPGDINEIGSMTYTQSVLSTYLYGHRLEWEMVDGKLIVHASKNAEHRFGTKVIPSGFFDLSGAENISAVLFSNAGTLAKFDRMGLVAGFHPEGHRYYRIGIRYNPDPNATDGIPFYDSITDASYEEFWSDELQLFHNPNAKTPIPVEMFSGITQHFFEDGNHQVSTPEGAVLSSRTVILSPKKDERADGSIFMRPIA